MIPMSKRSTKGLIVAGVLVFVLVAAIMTTDFEPYFDTPQELPTFPDGHSGESIFDGDELVENSLPYAIFEQYGFVLIPLAVLMFGAMVGGVVISKEEVEE
jgi:NADH:ubiquinone oxidoreductase subunit 6 (subunit J)